MDNDVFAGCWYVNEFRPRIHPARTCFLHLANERVWFFLFEWGKFQKGTIDGFSGISLPIVSLVFIFVYARAADRNGNAFYFIIMALPLSPSSEPEIQLLNNISVSVSRRGAVRAGLQFPAGWQLKSQIFESIFPRIDTVRFLCLHMRLS